VIACDAIVGANNATLNAIRADRTFVVLNSHATPTAAFLMQPNWQPQTSFSTARIARLVKPGLLGTFDAEQIAIQLLGHSIFSNLLMLGYAWQKGRVPLSREALLRAIELNGVQVDDNKAAFEWGRRYAQDPADIASFLANDSGGSRALDLSLADVIAKRVSFLTSYQNETYAAEYDAFVKRVRKEEARIGSERLTEAVARYLFKLMAYKDEYEVARLHVDPDFLASIAATFDGNYRLVHHLAPPGLARKNAKGELIKRPFGPWVRSLFRVLAALKCIRGTAFDPFGYSAERKTERALIAEYRACIEELLATLSDRNLETALEIARLPEGIRGYGHVKARHLQEVREQWAQLMTKWRKQCEVTPRPVKAALAQAGR